MAVAQAARRSGNRRAALLRYVGPALLLAVAASVAIVNARSSSVPKQPAPVAVRSSGATYLSLTELIAASAVVVDGHVTNVSDGRLFSEGGSAGIRSKIITLQIDEVLAGRAPGDRVAIEEESATADGTPLEVDGLRSTRAHDEGIFFLVASPDPTVPYYVTVSTAGRYLRRTDTATADVLMGTDGSLAVELAGLGRRGLSDAVRRLAHNA